MLHTTRPSSARSKIAASQDNTELGATLLALTNIVKQHSQVTTRSGEFVKTGSAESAHPHGFVKF